MTSHLVMSLSVKLLRRIPAVVSHSVSRNFGTVTPLKSERQFDEVLESSVPTLIDFHADWCGPCKILTPTLKTLIEDHPDEVNLLMVNVDQFGDIAFDHDVNAIPCVKIAKDGNIISSFTGVKTQEEITKILEEALKKS